MAKIERTETRSRYHELPKKNGTLQPTCRKSNTVIGCAIFSLLAFVAVTLVTGLPLSIYSRVPVHAVTQELVKYSVPAPPLLQDFQVYPPVLTPSNDGAPGPAGSCVVHRTLMNHVFADSYNNPFVATYQPPDCDFNRVTFNLTVVSAGRQYDRLGIAYFGSTEIWRFSTAEPTQDGIIFTYSKDMSSFLSLFKAQQTFIFDLGNEITSMLTGTYNATLKATFFTSEDTIQAADAIYTLSTNMGSQGLASVFQYPQMNVSEAFTLPQNTRKAVFTIAATGQIDEEFWFGNVPTPVVDTFGAGFLYPASPFREVQLRIDGMLAGVVWPFPIIFTGGVVPGFWRPIVGIDAFDLKEDEIDITPWLPLLCDGKSHTFQLNVTGINGDGKGQKKLTPNIGSYWLLTGKIFTWLDPAGHVTTGSSITHQEPIPSVEVTTHIKKTPNGKKNETLTYSVAVARQFQVQSTVTTASGSQKVTWSQNLQYQNHGKVDNAGFTQYLSQLTTGNDSSSLDYSRQIKYPVKVNMTVDEFKSGALSIEGAFSRGQTIDINGQPVFPTDLEAYNQAGQGAQTGGIKFTGSMLRTKQNGTGHYFANANNTKATSFGSTQQEMTYSGSRRRPTGPSHVAEFYNRRVLAVNTSIVYDREKFLGHPFKEVAGPANRRPDAVDFDVAPRNIKRIIGRPLPSSQD